MRDFRVAYSLFRRREMLVFQSLVLIVEFRKMNELAHYEEVERELKNFSLGSIFRRLYHHQLPRKHVRNRTHHRLYQLYNVFPIARSAQFI